jgi:hypothetical protein
MMLRRPGRGADDSRVALDSAPSIGIVSGRRGFCWRVAWCDFWVRMPRARFRESNQHRMPYGFFATIPTGTKSLTGSYGSDLKV